MKAYLKNLRQSPRKVRLVADLVRGMKVGEALSQLEFLPKRAAKPVAKLIQSAVANAKTNDQVTNPENLTVKEIRVDEGVTLHRWRAKWRGIAHPIKKRSSHINVELGE